LFEGLVIERVEPAHKAGNLSSKNEVVMVKDELLDEQQKANIEHTRALTEEVRAATEIKKIQVKLLEKDLAKKQ
jgi:hypothetical protein